MKQGNSPANIEEAYQAVKRSNRVTSSRFTIVHQITGFISTHSQSDDLLEPYVLELVEYLPVFDHPLYISGIYPESIADSLHHLQRWSDNSLLQKHEHFQKSLTSLRHAFDYLKYHLGELPEYLKASQNDYYDSLRQQFAKVNNSSKGIFIPVIPSNKSNDSFQEPYGCLRHIKLTIYGKSPDERDHLYTGTIISGQERHSSEINTKSIQAARNLIQDTHPDLSDQFVDGRWEFQILRGLHRGQSSDLAIALLFYEEVLAHFKQRTTFQINRPIACTGSITASGDVEPVEQSTLHSKTEAVFFSALTTFIVPRSQEEDFKKVRDRLKHDYPDKELKIRGVDNLNDALLDRLITSRVETPRLMYAGRRLWDLRNSVTAISIIGALLIVLGLRIYGPIDKNPNYLALNGNQIGIYNSSGDHLSSIDANQPTITYYQYSGFSSQSLIIDINKDSNNDILYNFREHDKKTKLVAYDYINNKTIWTFHPGTSLEYSNHPYLNKDSWMINKLYRYNERIFPITRDVLYFPSTLTEINPKNGKVIEEYLHPGALYSLFFYDFNGEGINELLLTGTNNAFNQGSIIILPTSNFSGHGKTNAYYTPSKAKFSNELAYIRIPQTVVGNLINPIDQPIVLLAKKIEESNSEIIEVTIRDSYVSPSSVSQIVPIQYTLYLNPDLSYHGFGTYSDYDAASDRLVENGIIDQRPGADYFSSFADSLLYWNGTDWQHTPTFNAKYFEENGLNADSLGFNVVVEEKND